MQEIEFVYGLGSRYSYLAFTQITRIENRHACRFKLRPISSVELLEMRGVSPFKGKPISEQYNWNYRREDAKAWADFYKVPFTEPKELPEDHRLMARACHAADLQDELRPYSEAVFRAVFVDNEKIDMSTCVAVASRLELDAHRFKTDINSEHVEQLVTSSAQRAFDQGAFGVPTFFVGDRMFWGNDRLVLVESWLKSKAGSLINCP